ncbi:sugar transferase [Flavobacterium sp.]|uniref:sugar transferase n=1 Tax=Flavobacterium sp. TaxID=239 RepID=UPI00352945F4
MKVKRIFDFTFSILLILILVIPLLFIWVITCLDVKSNGFFLQKRIGQFGKPFTIYKLRTINNETGKISKWGTFLRKYKIDELPQLFNILKGEMSFVGPRPDISGYYDTLEGENRKILELKPGLTSEASIKYANEEELLNQKENPLQYNDDIIFPDKVQLNLDYYYNRSFFLDCKIIFKTIKSFL